MKKIFAILVCTILVINSYAAIDVTATHQFVKYSNTKYNVDYLVLINGIENTDEIRSTTGTTTEWTWEQSGTTYHSSSASLNIETGICYQLSVDGGATEYISVVDYSLYKTKISALDIVKDKDECDVISIVPTAITSPISYKDKAGVDKILPQDYTLSWNTSEYATDAWVDKPMNQVVSSLNAPIIVTTPLRNTIFTLAWDQIAVDMGITPQSIESVEYHTVAIKSNIEGKIEEREATNEKDKKGANIEGSGPLVILFNSNINPLDQFYCEWFVWSTLEGRSSAARYNDINLRYTFKDGGDYWVKLKASSPASTSGCSYVDSIQVTVMTSLLDIPNVFTPNGDGLNDEFRVAYRSIVDYHIYIVNRWGRKVYESNDPAIGWNGKINGKDAPQGTYYYVIRATGASENGGSGRKFEKSGDINLLR